MNSSTTLSVVMSVYNGEAYLAEAVESILAQTFEDFEFLIIDDGSKDRTAEMLADYAKRDGRVRLVTQENKGRAESLTCGIGLSRSRYIARMDADDISMPDRLREQVEFLDSHPEVGLLSGLYEHIDTNGRVQGTVRLPLCDSAIRAVMLRYSPMCHPAVMMRKEAACSAGGYRKALLDADDYDLWLRMAERTRLANLDRVILRYRIHRGQASVENIEHQTWCVLAARAAFLLRSQGRPDPLESVAEITPGFLASVGVSEAEIECMLIETYQFWIESSKRGDPEVALRFIERLLKLSGSEGLERRALAEARLAAATIHYGQGRLGKALLSVGHGVLTRPIVAGRPIKSAFRNIAKGLALRQQPK
jgi:hypothetical protein